ncbi:hypothetical protein Vretimale_2197 [Volvox reticuliferus]|uniref:Uncharacterized protein n=1 Tax=Volvox reticuliferus TaxID=1737510 RepID=A0A8J4D6Z1_9CHLO|nr:hypothetical protein Vretifemale_4501 [Volvox reticuliferus]GIL96341.1 hypothetical protein Vretimale_2197 [Volvox reticuliferus]
MALALGLGSAGLSQSMLTSDLRIATWYCCAWSTTNLSDQTSSWSTGFCMYMPRMNFRILRSRSPSKKCVARSSSAMAFFLMQRTRSVKRWAAWVGVSCSACLKVCTFRLASGSGRSNLALTLAK